MAYFTAFSYYNYDIATGKEWSSIGMDHDTAAFAVKVIRTWWSNMG